MPMTAQDYADGLTAFRKEQRRRAQGAGPKYAPGGYRLPWGDQYFERDFEPAGTVNCGQALRVGATLSALDIFVKANVNNEAPLLIPAGSTITLSLLQSDEEEGTFEDVGPTVCMKAPPAGMEIEPGMMVCRFPVGDFRKPWLAASLEFSGAITGGNVDCCLGFIPR